MKVNTWKVTAELNNDNNFNSCIVEAATKEKADKMAKKYFIKKLKAETVNIIDISLIDEEK
jgi:hypothetical protein